VFLWLRLLLLLCWLLRDACTAAWTSEIPEMELQ